MAFNIIDLLILIICLYLLVIIFRLEGRVKSMKYTLDRMTQQDTMANEAVNSELRGLLNEGKEVKAVKRTRELLGFSLLEAKQYIDKLKAEEK